METLALNNCGNHSERRHTVTVKRERERNQKQQKKRRYTFLFSSLLVHHSLFAQLVISSPDLGLCLSETTASLKRFQEMLPKVEKLPKLDAGSAGRPFFLMPSKEIHSTRKTGPQTRTRRRQ